MTTRHPSKLLELLERVKKASSARGKRKDLAEELGTSRQQLNAWLSGVKMPGGEVTLLMLEWVKAEEAKQQKTVVVLRTPPRRQTRLRKSREEKPKPSPKRK